MSPTMVGRRRKFFTLKPLKTPYNDIGPLWPPPVFAVPDNRSFFIIFNKFYRVENSVYVQSLLEYFKSLSKIYNHVQKVSRQLWKTVSFW